MQDLGGEDFRAVGVIDGLWGGHRDLKVQSIPTSWRKEGDGIVLLAIGQEEVHDKIRG